MLLIYGSFAIILFDQMQIHHWMKNPENLVTKVLSKREQYGSALIFFGQYWNSELNDRENGTIEMKLT